MKLEKPASMNKDTYLQELRKVQIELVKFQRHLIHHNDKILVLFEGRDGAGKDSTIKRITAHLSPRETRVVALGKPSNREDSQWYFQRYIPHLPSAQEFVVFNRSWYNRAGVEHVMGFCSPDQYEEFMNEVVVFEGMLVRSGIHFFKIYLDISKKEQKTRLAKREADPLKQWKVSPVDQKAIKHWGDYSRARDAMFVRTHTALTPWTVVRADDKKVARINVIKLLLSRLSYANKDKRLARPDTNIVSEYGAAYLKNRETA
ncbi:MAG: polyphosphate kinase 2 [Acidiferrobacteraceae bacterium]